MAVVKPFRCIRPVPEQAKQAAALPYDVYSEQEARAEVAGKPFSFLNIDRPETQFPEGTDPYGQEVYEKAAELLEKRLQDGIYLDDRENAYYIYELTMDGKSQTGIVGCSSVDDYLNGVVKKHENTREEKELDRIRHVDVMNAQTGPIFLAYRASAAIVQEVDGTKRKEPL